MSRNFLVLIGLILVLMLSACGANSSQQATMTALASDLNSAKTQLANANARAADMEAKLAEANDKIATYEAQLAPASFEKPDALYGEWVDNAGDSWNFQLDARLHAVIKGVPYDTAWYSMDNNTIAIDFAPIYGKAKVSILELDFVVMGDTLTFIFSDGQTSKMTRVR